MQQALQIIKRIYDILLWGRTWGVYYDQADDFITFVNKKGVLIKVQMYQDLRTSRSFQFQNVSGF